MTSQEKGNWIRRIFMLGLLGAAVAGGLLFVMPGRGENSEENKYAVMKVTRENIARVQASPDKLTVTNLFLEGNPNSEKLKQVLEKIHKEKKYGERVVVAELDVKADPELAASQGVPKIEEFAGQLDFHANGRKLEQLVGQADQVVIEKTIERLLDGLVQRVGKDWLPDVPGMQRDQGQEIIPIKPAEPSPSPRRP